MFHNVKHQLEACVNLLRVQCVECLTLGHRLNLSRRGTDMTESGKRWARGPQEEVRDQAMAKAMKRKEEYLGARVPSWLKDIEIERARDTGGPVSILIRIILEEAFREGRDGAQTRTSRGADTGAETHLIEARHRLSTVIGWEQIKLNRSMSCSVCG